MNDALGYPQSVLVLGGGSDLARATVAQLVAGRTNLVVLAGRRPEVLERAAAELRRDAASASQEREDLSTRAHGQGSTKARLTIETVHFDALDTQSHGKLLTDVFETHGGIDMVICAFAILGDQLVDEEDPGNATRVIDVNFTGAASALLWTSKLMRRQGHGKIVVFSSVAGERVRRANFIYGASKAGLDAFSQGLGDSLVGTGVSLMIVRPGFVRTQLTEGLKPAPLATTPASVADAVLAGLRDGKEMIWVPPGLKVAMSAMRHLPRPLFRRIKT